MKVIKELYKYREMIVSMVKKELEAKYKGSALGFLWTFINPLLQLIVYTIIFSIIMRAGIEKFYLFLFVGLPTSKNTMPKVNACTSVSNCGSCL